jgi:hypothetical protein
MRILYFTKLPRLTTSEARVQCRIGSATNLDEGVTGHSRENRRYRRRIVANATT